MDWFTSDTHFWHHRVIAYSKRPYATPEEAATFDLPRDQIRVSDESVLRMNKNLIERWNARVSREDRVFHLGDFSFGSPDKIRKIVSQLNGCKVLVIGNHDFRSARTKNPDKVVEFFLEVGFNEAYFETVLWAGDQKLFLTHRPADIVQTHWEGCKINLHGHVHEHWVRRDHNINVGVDVRDFAPATLEELLTP